MSDFYPVSCINCGKQTMIDLDRPGDTCLFCGKDARKKEEIMQEKNVEGAVPIKPIARKGIWKYYDENREAIIVDYRAMPILDFLKRWGIPTSSWQILKKRWGVTNKRKWTRLALVEESTAKERQKPTRDVDVSLTEHERYLILLGYQQATREFLRAKCQG